VRADHVDSVVAITGLSGHAYGSWRGRGDFNSMWLRDFLKDDEVLRHCRTLTFGYNSKISARGTSCIQDYTEEFLEELGQVRRTDEASRPSSIIISGQQMTLIV
jgi:hypothetical protein